MAAPKIIIPETPSGKTTFEKTKKNPTTGATEMLASHEEEHPDIGWAAPTGEHHANVNVSVGRRVGLPEYSDVRFSVSLTLPAEPTNAGIEEAEVFARHWCYEKMGQMYDELIAKKG